MALGLLDLQLAVHWTRIDDVLSEAGNLSDKLLLTCSLLLVIVTTVSFMIESAHESAHR
jgi:hypothetical protein